MRGSWGNAILNPHLVICLLFSTLIGWTVAIWTCLAGGGLIGGYLLGSASCAVVLLGTSLLLARRQLAPSNAVLRTVPA
jgi:hypothetical protein